MRLLHAHPGKSLVCITVVMPGAVKRNRESLVIARAAATAVRDAFADDLIHWEERDLPTGYEGYLLTSLPPAIAKERTSAIEEKHPLGRLFDLDVIREDGIPVSRLEMDRPARKCLICDQPARLCMRTGVHTYADLLTFIQAMCDRYASGL